MDIKDEYISHGIDQLETFMQSQKQAVVEDITERLKPRDETEFATKKMPTIYDLHHIISAELQDNKQIGNKKKQNSLKQLEEDILNLIAPSETNDQTQRQLSLTRINEYLLENRNTYQEQSGDTEKPLDQREQAQQAVYLFQKFIPVVADYYSASNKNIIHTGISEAENFANRYPLPKATEEQQQILTSPYPTVETSLQKLSQRLRFNPTDEATKKQQEEIKEQVTLADLTKIIEAHESDEENNAQRFEENLPGNWIQARNLLAKVQQLYFLLGPNPVTIPDDQGRTYVFTLDQWTLLNEYLHPFEARKKFIARIKKDAEKFAEHQFLTQSGIKPDRELHEEDKDQLLQYIASIRKEYGPNSPTHAIFSAFFDQIVDIRTAEWE